MNAKAWAWLPVLAYAGLGVAAALLTPEPAPVLGSLRRPQVSAILRPPPTEYAQDYEAETRNKEARKEWRRQKHRAPPGFDTTQAERKNGVAQAERRRALHAAPPDDALGRWVERGSTNQAGRSHVARERGGELYVGSSLGGLWRGTTEGTDWTPLGDNLYGGVHYLEVLDDGGAAVLLTASDSGIVSRSTDDGATWTTVGDLAGLSTVKRLVMASDGTQKLYLLGAVGRNAVLYTSSDLGVSWTEVLTMPRFSGDVWVPRDGSSVIYLVTEEGVSVSSDGGVTRTVLSTLDAGVSQAELVGSEAGAPRLWLVTDSAFLLRSDDGGVSFSTLDRVSDYWNELNASIVDPDLFAYGGVNLTLTYDGGNTFTNINTWDQYYDDPANLLHADMMGIDVRPTDSGETWYVNTDGGTYRSLDQLSSVENLSLSGLRISQYYSTLTSSTNPDNIAAGAQDQGYQITNREPQDGGDLHEFEQAISGDYGHLTSSDGSHAYVYSVYPGFVLVQVGETDPWLGYADFPDDTYVPWLPPIIADPEDPRVFYFPAQRLYQYTFNNRTGYAQGEVYGEQDFARTADEYVSILRFAPTDPQRAYAATSNGRLFYSSDKALTWTLSDDAVPDENWYYGQAIAVSLTDANTVTIGGSGYGSPAVYRSTDGGVSFDAWGEGLPDTLVYCLCEAPDRSGVLLAGTESAVYYRGPEDSTWVDVTDTTSPITTYWSCETLTSENTVRFATYGRGIWDFQFAGGCIAGQDEDSDGSDCLSDCDDADATVFPGSDEVCDGRDANCDANDLAEGDGDGDGALACADCDDADADRAPGLVEVCGNAVDEDCDGLDTECEPEAPGGVKVTGGCGCATGTGVGWAALFVGAGLLRRRWRG